MEIPGSSGRFKSTTSKTDSKKEEKKADTKDKKVSGSEKSLLNLRLLKKSWCHPRRRI